MRKRSTGSSWRAERSPRGASAPGGPVPTTPAQVDQVLAALELAPSKRLGQNFLLDPEVAAREAALLDVPPGTEVLEVGGGLGQLTWALLERGFQVTVLEADPKLSAFLSTNLGRRARIVTGDARARAPGARVCAGNLPFSVAGEILEHLVAHGMEHGAFLVQKEVAERLTARPGTRAYGRPTILFRVDGTFHLAGAVPSSAFRPAPKVEGALVVWRADPLEPGVVDRHALEGVLAVAFAQRRKMLGGTLPAGLARHFHLASAKESVEKVRQAGWPTDWATRRAEEIPPESFVALANALAPSR